jgi:hypothetical protein
MIVTTAMTAATPTTMPTKVRAVRSLLVRRLASATRNASHTAVRRNSDRERFRALNVSPLRVEPDIVPDSAEMSFAMKEIRRAKNTRLVHVYQADFPLSDLFVFLDQPVANGNDAVRAGSDIGLVRHHNDGVSFAVQPLKEVHDFHAGVCIERAGRFVRQQN